ncbi:MAG: VWA domain-containing protein [Cyanobacteria bacterium]|nr:VWA domain-containing protein [Cyanobacteriota bacterium]
MKRMSKNLGTDDEWATKKCEAIPLMKAICSFVPSLAIMAAMLSLSGCSAMQEVADDNVGPGESIPAAAPGGVLSLKRNFYFVFDGSGSMLDAPDKSGSSADHQFTAKIDGAKWAVGEFMKNVPKDVNLGLYVFDDKGEREVLPLGSNNRELFLQDIKAVDAGGATPLGDAVSKGVQALVDQYKKQLGYGEFRLIVITDGEATDDLDKGIRRAKRHHIPIYTIGFAVGENHRLKPASVSYRSADSAKQLKKALEEAASELDVFDSANFSKN